MISALILTYNEEANLERCLSGFKWCKDVVVFDSYSTDGTVAIARQAGARVVQRRFDNWADHQNWAVSNIAFDNAWVYYSDADELVSTELQREMVEVVSQPTQPFAAYAVRFRVFFRGRWIRRSSLYPTWVVRLFRPERIRWERVVNPTPVVSGEIGKLREHFDHYTFNKGISAWVEKHNRYSDGEAVEALRALRGGNPNLPGLLSRSAIDRRKAAKDLSSRLPFRPTLRFIYMYVLRGGFLDGRAGFTYCRLLSIYEYLIVLKMQEIQRRERGLPT